jgi:hypothetical protein
MSAPYPRVSAGLASIEMAQDCQNPFALETFSGAREVFVAMLKIWADLFDRERSWIAKDY